jgi:hypothetical protein
MNWLDNAALLSPHLMLCLSERPYLKVVKKFNIKEPNRWVTEGKGATCHHFYNQATNKDGILSMAIVCMQVQKGNSYNQIASLLAHEAVHVAQNMFDDMGEEKPGREVEAYCIQRIFLQLLNSYKAQTKHSSCK